MHLEILDEKRKKIFETLKSSSFIRNFELGGGTALALQIGHRISVDFDFFAKNLLEKGFLENVEKELLSKDLEVLVNNSEELSLLVDGVKVSFIFYPFPRQLPCVDLGGINALSILEIASTKAYTIGRRSEYKDYVDLYFLLKEKDITLNKIIDLCNKKYGSKFNSRLFLEQLILEEDVEEVKIHFVKESINKEELFTFFKNHLSKNFKLDS